jgi:hypothetical protein
MGWTPSKNRKHFELIALLSLGGAILSNGGCRSAERTVFRARIELPALDRCVSRLAAEARAGALAVNTPSVKVR